MKYNNRSEVERIGKSSIFSYQKNNRIVSRILSGFMLVSDPADKSITPHFQNDGFWEAWITLWISRNVKPGSRCIDAGANYGYFTFQLAMHNCSVIAIEANPNMCLMLVESNMLNGFERIDITQTALSNTNDSEIEMFLFDGCANYSVTKQTERFLRESTGSVKVKTSTLDQLIGSKPIDFIKMDIEGAEELAWDGMQQVLRNNPHCVILLEFAPYLLENRGARFFNKMAKDFDVTIVDFDGNEKPIDYRYFEAMSDDDFAMVVLRKKQVLQLAELLHPYDVPLKKVRYGRESDGGYVVFEQYIQNTEAVYTLGIGDDISFEEALVRNPEINPFKRNPFVRLYDHTVDQLPVQASDIPDGWFEFKKMKADSMMLIREIISNKEFDNRNMLLKIDIEGDEYEIFDTIDIEFFATLFRQIIVEFHDVLNAPTRIFHKLNERYHLGHIHGNNHAPCTNGIPNVIECTYIRKLPVLEYLPKDMSSFPKPGLDFPNKPGVPDYELNFWKKNITSI